MTKENYIKKTERLLEDHELYKASLAYYTSILDCAELSRADRREIEKKEHFLSRTVRALEHALSMLTPTEREIIKRLYFDSSMSFDDVCEACCLERSSIYRYRSSAIKKIAKAIFGAT